METRRLDHGLVDASNQQLSPLVIGNGFPIALDRPLGDDLLDRFRCLDEMRLQFFNPVTHGGPKLAKGIQGRDSLSPWYYERAPQCPRDICLYQSRSKSKSSDLSSPAEWARLIIGPALSKNIDRAQRGESYRVIREFEQFIAFRSIPSFFEVARRVALSVVFGKKEAVARFQNARLPRFHRIPERCRSVSPPIRAALRRICKKFDGSISGFRLCRVQNASGAPESQCRESRRLLSAAVSSHRRKRCRMGQGLYGMAECDAGVPAFRGALSAARAG